MPTKRPLFDFSKTAKDLIESNNHVDWSAFNNSLPWEQKASIDSYMTEPNAWFIKDEKQVLDEKEANTDTILDGFGN